MSTLEKATELLQKLPKNKLEAVYLYMQFVDKQVESEVPYTVQKKSARSRLGIAHEYADPDLVPLEKEAFANAMAEKHAIN